jgi:hypothetical protein
LSAITLGNCFEPSIKVNELAKVNDFVFCGTTGYGFPDHIGRYVLLKEIMKDPRLMVWGSEPSLWSWKLKSEFLGFFMDLTKIFPVDFVFKLLNLSKNHKLISLSRYIWASKVSGMSGRAVLSTRNDVYRIFANSKSLSSLYPGRVKKPITNGADYYGLVKSSRITLNIHRDEDADIGNIRCFEATGLGSCLITDHGKGMKEFFDIDNEIVTFESAEECIEKLNYLERYPIELEKIRERGQRRTLKDHTTKNRVDKIAEVIKNYYRGNNQSNKLILKKKRLIANYDLDRHPISYDFIFFLQAAYIKSQELEVNEVMVNINWPANLSDIPGLHGDAAKIFSDKIEIRIKNILLDVGALFPFTIINNIKNSILIENDDSVETYYFPEEKVHHNEYYRIVNKNPNKLYDVRATNNAVNYIKEYARKFSNKKIITLTLRSYKLDEIRNNNEKEWAKFLETLNKNKYKIIIIPDTDNIFHKDQTDLKIYDSFHPASFNFDIRLALYEIAYINFFVNNGPCVAATLDSKVNFLLFKIINPSVPHCTIEFLEDAGFKSFKNPEYLGNYQRYIWSDDSYEEINRAFKKLNHDMNV